MRGLILPLLLCLPIPLQASQDPWTTPQIAMEIGYQAALICDWRQTSSFRNTWGPNPAGGYIVEKNPLLGEHPSQGTINNWCIISSIGHLAVSHYLGTKWRTRWQAATLTVEVAVVAHNRAHCKVKIRF